VLARRAVDRRAPPGDSSVEDRSRSSFGPPRRHFKPKTRGPLVRGDLGELHGNPRRIGGPGPGGVGNRAAGHPRRPPRGVVVHRLRGPPGPGLPAAAKGSCEMDRPGPGVGPPVLDRGGRRQSARPAALALHRGDRPARGRAGSRACRIFWDGVCCWKTCPATCATPIPT
jgi:hypothetical protein